MLDIYFMIESGMMVVFAIIFRVERVRHLLHDRVWDDGGVVQYV